MKPVVAYEEVNHIWDGLADFGVNQTEEATSYLMSSLCDLVGAWNANWTGAVRLSGDHAVDPLKGWRVPGGQQLHAVAPHPDEELIKEIKRRWERREVDPAFLLPLKEVGTFRCHIIRRDLPTDWFDSPYYKQFYASVGTHDSVWVGFPVNQDAESYFGFHSRQPFTEEEAELLAFTLRGIKWFHRRLMLSHGLLVASTPLMPRERDVLKLLLTEATEKQIAEQLGLALSTTHNYVTGVFRKFGVRGRAGLMSLWLNQASG